MSAQDWLFLLHKGPLPCEGASAPTVAALLPGALRERSESEGRLPTLLRPKKEENIARMPLGIRNIDKN